MAQRCLTVLVLGTACYMLAMSTGVGWLFLFAALIWVFGLTSATLAWFSLRGLKTSRQLLKVTHAQRRNWVPGIFQEDEVVIGLIIENQGWLPKYCLKLKEYCPLEEPKQQARSFLITHLGRGSVAQLTYRAKCHRRGEFVFPCLLIESGDPFGLFTRRQEFLAPFSLLVYPATYPLDSISLRASTFREGLSQKARSGTLVCGSREYQAGDSLRRVHWYNTARWSRLMVKEFEEAAGGSLVVTFDAQHNFGEGEESTLEYSIKIAASLAQHCAARSKRFYLVPGRGLSPCSLKESLEYLARLRPGTSTNLKELLQLPQLPHPVLLIVSLADAKASGVVKQLSLRATDLIIIALAGFAAAEMSPESLLRVVAGKTARLVCGERGKFGALLKELNWLT